MTDPEAESARALLCDLSYPVNNVRTIRTYLIEGPVEVLPRLIERVLSNDAVELAVIGALPFCELGQGQPYRFHRVEVMIRDLNDQALLQLSRDGQLSLSLAEMKAIQRHFVGLGRNPTDCELETLLARPGASTLFTQDVTWPNRVRGENVRQFAQARPSFAQPAIWLAIGW